MALFTSHCITGKMCMDEVQTLYLMRFELMRTFYTSKKNYNLFSKSTIVTTRTTTIIVITPGENMDACMCVCVRVCVCVFVCTYVCLRVGVACMYG